MSVESAEFSGAAEVIVWHDGCEHEQSSRHRSTENMGISDALNRAFAVSTQPLVCRLDAGDTMHTDKLERQVALGAPASFHDYRDTVRGCDVVTAPNWSWRVFTDNQFCGSTLMVTRDTWQTVGGFDEHLRWCVDWDFAGRVQAEVGWQYMPGVFGTAAQYPGGHSDRGANTPARARDRQTVRKRMLALKAAA
jgi:hypothetical protein